VNGEREKMLGGELYDPLDLRLTGERGRARMLLKALNDSMGAGEGGRSRIIKELFGAAGEGVWIEPPFYCDYGSNIFLGDRVFFNFNCVVLDPAAVRIGSHTMFGPAVQIYTATHPMSAADRQTGLELARPVEIGPGVWVGGGAIICPGVRIGSGSVIGAGSVVTRDVPESVFAAGNPCRVVQQLTA
jgi:maltose O-acetyltransferase